MSVKENAVENNQKALQHFGKTYRWSETGYLLLNGDKLDFSGKNDGAPGGSRTVDHRDISDALGDDYDGFVFFNDYSWYNGKVYVDNGVVTNDVKISEEELNDFVLDDPYLYRFLELNVFLNDTFCVFGIYTLTIS